MRRLCYWGLCFFLFVLAGLAPLRAQNPIIEEPITLDFTAGDCLISLPRVIANPTGISDAATLCAAILLHDELACHGGLLSFVSP